MTIKELEELFTAKCVNLYRAASVVKGQAQPIRYERKDLNDLAKKAYARGDSVFYAVNINPDDPNSEMIESNPIYEYYLSRGLTEEEYVSVFEDKIDE